MGIKRQEIDGMCLFLFAFYSYLVKDNIGTSMISVSPENKASTWAPDAALIPPTHVVTKDASMLFRASPRFLPIPSAR